MLELISSKENTRDHVVLWDLRKSSIEQGYSGKDNSMLNDSCVGPFSS